MENVFIRPRLLAEGEHGYVEGAGNRAVVPDPVSQRTVNPEGENKPLDQYWSARLRDGDVEVAMPAAPGSVAPSPLEGEGGEGGGRRRMSARTPTPDPSPQGGGER